MDIIRALQAEELKLLLLCADKKIIFCSSYL